MKKILRGFMTGLNAIYTPPKYPILKGSDSDRIMSDVVRVGEDFKRILSRKHDKVAQQ